MGIVAAVALAVSITNKIAMDSEFARLIRRSGELTRLSYHDSSASYGLAFPAFFQTFAFHPK